MAMHPDGKPAVAYEHSTDGMVKYAKWTGSEWAIETVDEGGPGVSLAFDPLTGDPAISHSVGGKLRFAQFDGSNWNVEVLVSKYSYSDFTSLAYDADGRPCIAYLALSGRGSNAVEYLYLTCYDGSGWEIRPVRPAGARYKSLAFDPDGNPVIAYSDDSLEGDDYLDTLKIAWWNGSDWDFSTVGEQVSGAGTFASLAFDPLTGKAMITDSPDDFVRFHYQDAAGDWQTVKLGDGYYSDLAVLDQGMPYISYESPDPDMLRVARPVIAGSYDQWEFLDVEKLRIWGPTSIAINDDGLPVVGYTDRDKDVLRWAERLFD